MADEILDLPADWWLDDEPQQPPTPTDRHNHVARYASQRDWLEGDAKEVQP